MPDIPNNEIKLVGVILVDSKFLRIPDAVFDGKEENNFKIELNAKVNEDSKFATGINFILTSKNLDKEQVNLELNYIGLFETSELNQEQKTNFAYINAPAIIYPFIRQYVYSLCSYANLPNIILPILNFVKLSEERGYISKKEVVAK
ncbi:MAG: protein-export chaperone SecB [Bacteroidota bacterium]